MAVAFKFQGSPSANDHGMTEKRLKRDDGLFPGQLASWALVGSAGWLDEPAGIDILAPQARGIAMALHPGGVDKEPFGKGFFQKVQLARSSLSHA